MTDKLLLLGRSGSGKTRFVLDRLAERIRTGGRSILLVPTFSQASHIRRILLGRTFNLPGFFDETVLTFTGLAERILADRPIGEILSGVEQDLLIRRALLSIPPSVFSPVSRHAGFRRAAVSFLKELKQNGRNAADLEEELQVLSEEKGGAVGARLAAFRLLFSEYERLKAEADRIDHEDFLRDARDALLSERWAEPVGLFLVDGFQNFTELERDLVAQLARRSDETVVTLAFDPAHEDLPDHNFSVASETRDQLRRRGFRERFLTGNHRATEPALRELEAGLFAPDPRPLHPAGVIRILEGADPRDEADRVARTVVRLVRGEDGKQREYRDIAVIVRDVRSRRTLFADAFARHGIPLRIQGQESLLSHPLARSALSLLRVACGTFDRDDLLGLLRSDHLVAVAEPEIDRLEYDLLENGPPGDAEEWVDRVRVHAPGAADLLAILLAAGSADPTDGHSVMKVVLDRFAEDLVPIWKRSVDAALIRAEAAAWSAMLQAVREIGDDFAREGAEIGLTAFTERLVESVKGTVYGARDRRLTVVDLIDAREARQWEAPVVIVSGLTEGEFPRSPREDIFLADADRAAVNRDGRLCLKERLLERNEERYLFYVAMTRAWERLYLTYPATDGGGRETMRSLFLDEVLRLMPEEERTAAVSRRPLSRALPEPEDVVQRGDLVRISLAGLARPFRPGTEEEATPLQAAALSDLLLADPGYGRTLATAARFRDPFDAALARPGVIAELQPPSWGRSPTALETFARCPFKHFAGRTLRLEGPPRVATGGLDGLVLGNIAHLVLERMFEPVVTGSPLPDEETLLEVFHATFAEQTVGLPIRLGEDRARRRLLGILRKTIAHERERLRGSEYRPRYLEAAFGPRREWKVSVRGEDGREVPLTGRIDRMDVGPEEDGPGRGAVVLDYKYSRYGFGEPMKADAAEGRHLQLPIYLLALQASPDFSPCGAWLYPLLLGRTGGYQLEPGPAPDKAELIDEPELQEMHERTSRLVLDFDRRILAGEITALPATDVECTRCDFGDVCRWNPWMREGEEE